MQLTTYKTRSNGNAKIVHCRLSVSVQIGSPPTQLVGLASHLLETQFGIVNEWRQIFHLAAASLSRESKSAKPPEARGQQRAAGDARVAQTHSAPASDTQTVRRPIGSLLAVCVRELDDLDLGPPNSEAAGC